MSSCAVRPEEYNPTAAQNAIIDVLRTIKDIPWGGMEYDKEKSLRDNIEQEAQKAYANPTQEAVLGFRNKLMYFWSTMTL